VTNGPVFCTKVTENNTHELRLSVM